MSTRAGSVRRRHTRTCASRDGGRCRCSGAWQFRARTPDGGRVEQGGFATKEDAQKALRDLLRDVDRGTHRRLEPVAFDEYARGWLEAVRPTVRPSTHASYSQIVRTHLEPYFGSMMVGAITPAHVRAFVAAKSAARTPKGKPAWKPATVRNALVALKMILSAALEDGHAAISAAAKVSPPKVERPETEIVSAAELDRVYAVAGEPWEALFRFLSWTGCRRGEALALRWADVDLPAGRAFIRRSLGKFGEGAPKSTAGRRTVPLPPSLVALLRRHQLAQAPDGAADGGRVFRSRTGGPLDPDHVGRAWRRALRKAGVRHVKLHSLRDVAVSRMVSAGASIKTVQATVGHASPMLTLRTYAHLLEDDFDRLAQRLAELDGRVGRDPARDPSGPTSEHRDDSQDTSAEAAVIPLAMGDSG
jgi:integrase